MSAKEQPKPPVDWERIEASYRAGLLSVREIAGAHGVSHVAIAKHARRHGWTRDLQARIKAKADALVTGRTVTAKVTAEQLVTDREIIEANAEVIAGIRLGHRKDIGRARALAMRLLGELESQTDHSELFERLAELLESGDDINASDKRMETFRAVLSLPGRTKTMKDLGDTLHKLIGLERDAYDIGNGDGAAPMPTDVVLPSDPAEAARAYQRFIAGAR